MDLFFRKTGEGRPLFILHGLFGLSDNWSALSKSFSENGFLVYTVDLRNHGRSRHTNDFSYELMADDLSELLESEGIAVADFIGHSMGGKVLMFFSERHKTKIRRMIIVDIAPRYYAPHHQAILAALNAIDTSLLKSRKEAEEQLRNSITDEATIQFILKNLYWKEEDHLDWRFNLKSIEKNMEGIGKAFNPAEPIRLPVFFLRGGNSGYINAADEREIQKIYPFAEIRTIIGAGHWVHAEKPKEFLNESLSILK